MRLRVITGTVPHITAAARGADEPRQEQAGLGRALVPLMPLLSVDTPDAFRQTPFLAQLIAIKDQHPQTRERRRVEPHEAAAAYRATAALTGH
ncbi:MAG: hypothetical protein ACREB2_05735 [Pseudolabrys sp.]